MGERWRGMSAEDKVPYDEMAKQDALRYAADMAKYKGPAAQADEGGDEDGGESS
jgi:hypothetical protein